MNWLSIALAAAPGIVHGIETIIGDKASGATKEQIAKDSLSIATGVAGASLTGTNAAYASIASQLAGLVIAQTVTIAKTNGTYQKATAAATAAQQDIGVANAVTDLIKSIQIPAVPAK